MNQRKDALNSRYWTHLAFLLVLIVLTFFAYSNVLHGDLQLDDEQYLFENQYLLSPHAYKGMTVREFFTSGIRPVASFTFSLNYYFFGKDTFSYHLTNLLIHILNGVLVYVFIYITLTLHSKSPLIPLLRRGKLHSPLNINSPLIPSLSKRGSRKAGELQRGVRGDFIRERWIAFLTALLFSIHPIQTESVSYIVQRYESLSTLFYLASLTAFVIAVESRLRIVWLILFVLGFVLALGSKEIAVTLPLIAVLYGIFFLEKKDLWKNIAIPCLLLLGGLFIAAYRITSLGGHSSAGYDLPGMTGFEYLLTQFRVIVTYLRLIILPVGQNLDHDFPISRSYLEPGVSFSFILLASLLFIAAMLYRKWRAGSFFIFWFFIILLPSSSIVPLKDVIAEHRPYLSSVAIFFIFASGMVWIFERFMRRRSLLIAYCSLLIALFGILCTATYYRNYIWGSRLAMWEDVVNKSPNKARPHNNLGNCYLMKGDNKKAIFEYLNALKINPGNMETYYNIGLAFEKLWMRDIARDFFIVFVKYSPVEYAAEVRKLSLKYNITGDTAIPDTDLKKLHQRALDALNKSGV